MRLMMKAALERMLDTNMDLHLGRNLEPSSERSAEQEAQTCRRNGRSQETGCRKWPSYSKSRSSDDVTQKVLQGLKWVLP